MLAGDPHPQDGGPDAEAKGGLESERLAINAGGDRAFGADLELGGRPLTPWSLEQPSAVLRARWARRRL